MKGCVYIPHHLWFQAICNLCKLVTTQKVFTNINRNNLNKTRAKVCTAITHHCLDLELINFIDHSNQEPDLPATCQRLVNKWISPLINKNKYCYMATTYLSPLGIPHAKGNTEVILWFISNISGKTVLKKDCAVLCWVAQSCLTLWPHGL